jgi:AcrR family transcriptional regulator
MAGLRELKKAQTRAHIAATAARLFAERGYEAVSVVDVARAAEVSDQTVYNYFPAKTDLVLDLADEIGAQYVAAITERPADASPAQALRTIARADVERHRHIDLALARGLQPALCAASPAIRAVTLTMRDQHVDAVADAICATSAVPPVVARAHAAALVSVFQMIVDRIGRSVLDGTPPDTVADELGPAVELVLDDLDRHFHGIPAHDLPESP